MKIKCINNTAWEDRLTISKTYNAFEKYKYCYIIIDNLDKESM
jgi:hypothetical protein